MIERVVDVISPRLASLEPANNQRAQAIVDRLRQPVRIAVVGRVKSGKSTMVNALLGQQVAPTDVSECTRIVTWFHYGHPQRLEMLDRSGALTQQPLDAGGRLPRELSLPAKEIASLHVYLANELLTEMTLIDTPGIGSVNREFSAATEQLLAAASTSAADGADAIVFLMSQAVMADEREVLQAFTGSSDGASAASAVGILSRVDQLGDASANAWNVAVELAGQYAMTFRDDVAAVLPVAGLLAEASEAATVTEADAAALAQLAAVPAREFRKMLWSTDRFLTSDSEVSPEARERLLVRLDLYGIRNAVEQINEGVSGALALRRELSRMSGIGAVKALLSNYFRDSDHVLKVRSALRALDQLSYASEDPASIALRTDVERLRLDPLLQPVAELEAWHECLRGRVTLPAELTEQFRLLLTLGSPASRLGLPSGAAADLLTTTAAARMRAWRSFMVTDATPAQGQVARVVLRSLQLIYKAAGT